MQKHPRKKMQVVRHVLEGTEALRFLPLSPVAFISFAEKNKNKTHRRPSLLVRE